MVAVNYGAGVLSGLEGAGIMDLSVWLAGISGGSWLIAGMHVSRVESSRGEEASDTTTTA
jgi:hypothetical protein